MIEVHRDRPSAPSVPSWSRRYYDDNQFFRVAKDKWAQFGINAIAVARAWRERTFATTRARCQTSAMVAFAFAVPNGRTTQVYIALTDLSATQDAQGFAPFGRVVEGMDVADALNTEYGEALGGIRAGHQQPMFDGGNAYLDREFPRLDRIIRATVIEAGKAGKAGRAGGAGAPAATLRRGHADPRRSVSVSSRWGGALRQ